MPLCVLHHDTVVETVPLRSRITVGRAPGNDLVLHEPSVSGHHAVFYVEGGTTWVRDLGSTNGTFHRAPTNAYRRLTAPQLVAPGDQVRLGHVMVVAHEPDAALAAVGPLRLERCGSPVSLGVTHDHTAIPGHADATVVLHGGDAVSLALGTAEPVALDVGEPFDVNGERWVLRQDTDPTPQTLRPEVAAFPYALTVHLAATTADLEDRTEGRAVSLRTEARVSLLYALGRRWLDDGGHPDGGWLDDEDAAVSIWGRAHVELDRNNLNVLLHRVRTKLAKAGFQKWCLEKRPGRCRLRVAEVRLQ